MGNPHKGEVTLEAGDTAYRLVFNINTLCVLEDHLDMSVTAIAKKLSGDVRIGFMRSVIWAGLQEHHPDVTVKAAGDLIGEVGPSKIGPIITAAFSGAFGSEAAEGKPGPRAKAVKPPKAGTGSDSSESGTS